MKFEQLVAAVIEKNEDKIGKHSSEMFPWSIEGTTADVITDTELQRKFEELKKDIAEMAIAALKEDKKLERIVKRQGDAA